MKVTGLTDGCEYEFRVIAENIAGLGQPSQASKPATAQDPTCISINYLQ